MAATYSPLPKTTTTQMGHISAHDVKVTNTTNDETDLIEFDTAEQGARSVAVQVYPVTLNVTVKYYVSFDRTNWTAIDTVNMAGSAKATSTGVTVTAGSRDTFVLDYGNDKEHAAVRWHKVTATNASNAANTIYAYGCAK